jgi:DNA-binding NarL/FixJ family response regulator
MTTPSQIQKDLIKWRRAKVIELVSKGKNLSEIAEILKVAYPGT